MSDQRAYDAVVVGSGPNGLAAAIAIARAGRSALVIEAKETVGGGARTAELTAPGFLHDVCSAIHPMAVGSPFLSRLPLDEYGLEWIHPPAPVAHPFDDGPAAILERSVTATGEALGDDAGAYTRLMSPLVREWDSLVVDILGTLRMPAHPLVLGRFGLSAVRSAVGLGRAKFKGRNALGLFAGLAAHSMLPLDKPLSAAFGLVLAAAGHAVGWPLPRGGSQSISGALASYLRSLGGEIVTGDPVTAMDDFPKPRSLLFDVTPRQLVRIVGDRLPAGYRRRLETYRYGPGVFKMDWALDGPIPWRSEECGRAGTVHLGGTMEEIATAEDEVSRGGHPESPFVLLAQQSLFDSSRAPEGKHTGWAYCHVPNGSTVDMTDRIEAQVERFAPGFRDLILARSARSPAVLEEYNPNYVGGDINGGIQDLGQLFARPSLRLSPYTTPLRGVYICSSSTPPGGGVHGMCGYHAAQRALADMR